MSSFKRLFKHRYASSYKHTSKFRLRMITKAHTKSRVITRGKGIPVSGQAGGVWLCWEICFCFWAKRISGWFKKQGEDCYYIGMFCTVGREAGVIFPLRVYLTNIIYIYK